MEIDVVCVYVGRYMHTYMRTYIHRRVHSSHPTPATVTTSCATVCTPFGKTCAPRCSTAFFSNLSVLLPPQQLFSSRRLPSLSVKPYSSHTEASVDFNTDSLIQQVLRKEAGKQCFGWFVSVNFCGVAVSDSWGCGPWTWDVYAATPQTPTALAPSPSGFLEVGVSCMCSKPQGLAR